MTIYEADWICPASSPPIRNGRLAVEEGTFRPLPRGEGGTQSEAQRPGEGTSHVSFPGCAIIPGFVNAHSHLELTILRGFLDDLPFTEWIPRLTRTKYDLLTRDDILVSTRLGAAEMIRAGVTCLGEVMDLGISWDVMREFRLSGIAYQEVFGPSPQQMPEALEGLKQKVKTYKQDETETLRVGVSPHAPFTVSAPLYQAVNELSKVERLPLTTHIGESVAEGLFVRHGSGPFAERWNARGIAVSPGGVSPLAYINRFGLLRPETLLVHAIDLDDGDFELLREKRPAVVHCPKSNAKLGHGLARLSDIQNTGIPIGLGTDSVASNNVVDVFEEMRAAVFQQRSRTRSLEALDAQAVFHMATLGGAECLGLADHVGSLDAGKRADFVVVDLNDPAAQPVYDPIQTMVYSASRRNVLATYIAGTEAVVDATDLIHEASLIAERLKPRSGERS